MSLVAALNINFLIEKIANFIAIQIVFNKKKLPIQLKALKYKKRFYEIKEKHRVETKFQKIFMTKDLRK